MDSIEALLPTLSGPTVLVLDSVHDPLEPEAPGCLLVRGALACSDEGNGVRHELSRRRVEMLCRRFEQAHREGDLPAHSQPADMARYVVTVMNGISVQAAGGVGAADLRHIAKIALWRGRRMPCVDMSDDHQVARFALGKGHAAWHKTCSPAVIERNRQPQLLFPNFFDDVDPQVSLGEQALQSGSFFKFMDTGGFIGVRAAEASASAIERILCNVVVAVNFSDGLSAFFGLLQDGDDLLVSLEALLRIGGLTFLHSSILPFGSVHAADELQKRLCHSTGSFHSNIVAYAVE